MANVNESVNLVLNHEGGYVNDPHDSGGETKFGISKRSYPHLNISDITQNDAIEIYERDFWHKINGDAINSQLIANKLLDMAVLIGTSKAIKCLQRACNCLCGNIKTLDDDGVMGVKTLMKVNCLNENALIYSFKSECAGEFRRIGNDGGFLNGWLNRAYS